MTFNCPPKNLPNPISSQAYFLNINALQGRVLLLFFWGLKLFLLSIYAFLYNLLTDLSSSLMVLL